MGKGDIKTARGKRFAGSFGKTRPSKRTPATAAQAPVVAAATPPSQKEKAAPAKKPVAKKTTATAKKATKKAEA